MSFDLTIDSYRLLCDAIKLKQADCRLISYLNSAKSDGAIILRHDVDRKPERALRMARLESDVGIQSTYYFRSTREAFRPEIMHEIEMLGHEIGYHYEVLVGAKGDNADAMRIFRSDLMKFRKHVDIRTICSHGSPLSKFDSRDIWKNNSFEDLGIIGEASISMVNSTYFSDTGGKWGSTANIRDRTIGNKSQPLVKTTAQIINYVNNNQSEIIYINAHPERWSINKFESFSQLMKDSTINIIKHIILVLKR